MPKFGLNVEYSGHVGSIIQRQINMYVEPTPNGPEKFILLPRPALVQSYVLGDGPIRCSFLWKGHRIIVSGNNTYFDGINIGLMPGADLCRFAISDEEIVIIANNQAWYVTTTAVALIDDPDLAPALVDVLFIAGRFLYLNLGSSQFQWSDVGDARSIDGASFAEADENSSQTFQGGFILVDDIAFFLDDVVEWWSPQDDPNNPFVRSPGRKYNKGLAARATTVLLDNTIFFLGSDRIVYRAGIVPTRVSNFSIEDLLRQVADVDLPQCSAFGMVHGGHTFYVINMIGFGTWALDVSTSKWAEWRTWNKDRFRATVADSGQLGDLYSGAIFTFEATQFLELGDPIERVASAYLPVPSGMMRHDNIYLKCARGVGLVSGYGSTPVVEMRFSDHEGSKWSPHMNAPLGTQGDRDDTAKAIWTSLGAIRAPGRLIEFRCTDPVFFCPSAVYFNEARP